MCRSARSYVPLGSFSLSSWISTRSCSPNDLLEGFEAGRVPPSGDDPERIALRRALVDEIDEVRLRRKARELDVVNHRGLGTVDGIAKDRQQPHVGYESMDASGNDVGSFPPEHVARRRLADDRLARPILELLAIPRDTARANRSALLKNSSSLAAA